MVSCAVLLSLLKYNLTSPHTWHAYTGELSNAVQASGVILAGHGQAFVYVDLTAWTFISPTTLTLERALCVHTFPKMLTWVGTCGWNAEDQYVPRLQRQWEYTTPAVIRHLPIEHSSMSWLQAPPTKPAGQVQMARPLRGLVSHTAASLQGLLTHASSRWHSKPAEKVQTEMS